MDGKLVDNPKTPTMPSKAALGNVGEAGFWNKSL